MTSKLVVKSAGSTTIRSDTEETRVPYTTPLDNDATTLPLHVSPYPAMWQTYQAKAREWRVAVVGEQVFPLAVYTRPEAKDDWRKHQFTSGMIEFRPDPFPDEDSQRCIDMLRLLGLRFGAFDFVDTPDGQRVFLEVNPNGQFEIERELSPRIVSAVALELIGIAMSGRHTQSVAAPTQQPCL